MVSGLFVVAAVATCLEIQFHVSYALFNLELFVRAVLDTDFVLLIDRFCYAFYLIQSFVIFNM